MLPRGWIVVVISAGLLSGCGSGPPQPADANVAEAALREALESWRSGNSPEACLPTNVVDPDWLAGKKLRGFFCESPGETVGIERRFHVELEMDNGRGGAVKKNVYYCVGTDPIVTVVREEDLEYPTSPRGKKTGR